MLHGQFLAHVLRPGLTSPHARLSPSAKYKAKKLFDPTQNRIIGLVRLRQVRVRSDTCQSAFSDYIRIACYGDYTPANEEITPLKLK